jgi:hypothetical protein
MVKFVRHGAVMAALAGLFTGVAPASAMAAEVFGGVYAHDVDLGISVCCYEHGIDLQAGVRSDPIVSLHRLGDLRLYAFGSLNTSGGVDFGAAGMAWRLHLTEKLYVQPALGAAAQSGDADDYQRRPDHLDLGSRFLFEPEVSLGYRLAPQWAAELSYVHLSHARLAGPQNPGMDDLGVRFIYRLGR